MDRDQHAPPPSRQRPLAEALDGGAAEWAKRDAAYAAGEIDEAGWFAWSNRVLTAAYLARDNPRAQSGHSGDDARWEAARRPMLAAVDADGDLLDVGCASGYLMECARRWAAEDGVALEPYGLDISPELADLARSRLPHWADRIWTGNALHWVHPQRRRFDYVRTGLEYVPPGRAADLIAHLLEHVVGRRLVIGVHNEPAAEQLWRPEIESAGYRVAGEREWPKPDDARVVRRVLWIERE
jgi:SAM-dependent methyltransferase